MHPTSSDDVLDLSWTVNDIVQRYPATLTLLGSLGIDTCCGGALPLATVADKHHIELEPFRAALERVIRASAPAA